MLVLRRSNVAGATGPNILNNRLWLEVILVFLLTSALVFRLATAKATDNNYNGGKVSNDGIVAARPPRPDKTILEKLVFSGVEGVVGVIDKIPPTVLDLVEFPGPAAYDSAAAPAVAPAVANWTSLFKTEPAPVVEKVSPYRRSRLLSRKKRSSSSPVPVDESEDSHPLIRTKRFLPGVEFDFQRAAEEVLLAPLRIANGVGDNFARGLGGLLPPGSAAFPAGSPPPYNTQGYGGYNGPAYIVPANDISALPSNGGVFRRNVDDYNSNSNSLPLAVGEGATTYLTSNALPVGDLDAEAELPLADGELTGTSSGFVDYSEWF